MAWTSWKQVKIEPWGSKNQPKKNQVGSLVEFHLIGMLPRTEKCLFDLGTLPEPFPWNDGSGSPVDVG